MARTTFTGVNPTRAAISKALRDAGGDRFAALPALTVYLRAGFAQGWTFIRAAAMDLDAGGSPTLRALTMRALERADDPVAAVHLTERLIDRSDNPELAAAVWRESKRQIVGAVWWALRAEEQAWGRRAGSLQVAFQIPEDEVWRPGYGPKAEDAPADPERSN